MQHAGVGEVHPLPIRRDLFVDERGMGLRVTWHLDQSLVNLSIWRDDRCVETFRLSVPDAARLASLLVTGLGAAATGTDP